MAFAQAQTRQHSIAEINITPLVDVMLVMLVIFMIAAPVFSRPIPMTLPGSSDGPPQPPSPPLELRIASSGELFLGGRPMPMSALGSVFSAERERAGDQPVILRIDASGEVDYQVVAKVLATAQNAGLGNIRFK
ncbi:MAG: ExbD/TolR family protein [Pseudomonadota bacterium]